MNRIQSEMLMKLYHSPAQHVHMLSLVLTDHPDDATAAAFVGLLKDKIIDVDSHGEVWLLDDDNDLIDDTEDDDEEEAYHA